MRLVEKLVQVSGGWEIFLYRTLKGICDEMDSTDMGASLGDVYSEAKEILEAYEAATNSKLSKQPEQPNQVIPTPGIGAQAQAAVEVDESAKSAQSDEVESQPKPDVKSFTVRVRVDNEVGGCQGDLPLPEDFKLVNREHLNIETEAGLHLGKGSEDGQVRGSNVSGHVSTTGKYRLVLKDSTLGSVRIHFEAMYSPEIVVVDEEEEQKKVAIDVEVKNRVDERVNREVAKRLGEPEETVVDEKLRAKRVQMAVVAEAEKKAVKDEVGD